jgi:hypothetical protein
VGRDVLFILPNGARLRRRDLRSKQVYSVGSLVKTSKGLMVVFKSNSDDPAAIARDGHETVELRFFVPPYKDPVPIVFPGGIRPAT